MHNVNCIKCGQAYQDNDPDPYYCPPCNEEKKRIAAEIDKKMRSKGSRRGEASLLQEYDQAPKAGGFMIIKL